MLTCSLIGDTAGRVEHNAKGSFNVSRVYVAVLPVRPNATANAQTSKTTPRTAERVVKPASLVKFVPKAPAKANVQRTKNYVVEFVSTPKRTTNIAAHVVAPVPPTRPVVPVAVQAFKPTPTTVAAVEMHANRVMSARKANANRPAPLGKRSATANALTLRMMRTTVALVETPVVLEKSAVMVAVWIPPTTTITAVYATKLVLLAHFVALEAALIHKLTTRTAETAV